MRFVMLRQTRKRVLSFYVVQDRHKFRDTRTAYFLWYSSLTKISMYAKHYKGHGDFWSLISYHYVSQDSWKRAYFIQVIFALQRIDRKAYNEMVVLIS